MFMTLLLRILVFFIMLLLYAFVYGCLIFTLPAFLMLVKHLRKGWIFAASSAICLVLLIGAAHVITNHPRIVVPDELSPYATEERIAQVTSSLRICNPWKLCVPMTIEIVSASETHISAEARYTGFGGKLGATKFYKDGILTGGELYQPNWSGGPFGYMSPNGFLW